MLSQIESGRNPFVFVVGCPRSGTTLLRRILNAHPDLAMLETEQHWIVRYYARRKNLTADGLTTPALINKLFQHEKFLKLRIDRAEFERILPTGKILPYIQFIQILFDFYGRMHGKSFAGDKTPENVRNIPLLMQLWPSAKFVHIIRDGRDVTLSALTWEKSERLKRDFTTWNQNPIETAALWWDAHVRSGRTAAKVLGPGQYYEVFYEDLVNHPERETEKLSQFLSIPYFPSMTHYYEGKNQRGKDAKHSWLPVIRGLRDWRTQMSLPDQQLFEIYAGELLQDLGYETCFGGAAVSPADRGRDGRATETPSLPKTGIRKQFQSDFNNIQFGENFKC